MAAVLMISTLLNIAYLIPVVVRGFLSPAAEGDSSGTSLKEAPVLCLVPLTLTALGCLALFFFADDVYRLLLPIVQS
jgi:multicomponent Na+:H+ antiporter subunit D